jgi:hypothetical protein
MAGDIFLKGISPDKQDDQAENLPRLVRTAKENNKLRLRVEDLSRGLGLFDGTVRSFR